jgi:phospholipid/cholesterol/gamma-HCH transport system substrate-binding protein
MKLSNEAKVGLLAAAAILVVIFGVNFLKGKRLFTKDIIVYAKFTNLNGLPSSTASVKINGNLVGFTGKVISNETSTEFIVPIVFQNKVAITSDAFAIVNPSLLGVTELEIKQGSSTKFLGLGDTLNSKVNLGMFGDLQNKVDPVLGNVNKAISSLDSVLLVVSRTFDPNMRGNIQSIMANVNQVTANLVTTSNALQNLIASQQQTLNASMKNIESITGNFKNNNEKITAVMSNLETTTAKFKALDLNTPLAKMDKSMEELNKLLANLNNNEGTLGKLMKDPNLYNRFVQLTKSVNTLVDDLKTHPKRYVNVSVFGKKDKSTPLKAPIADSIP